MHILLQFPPILPCFTAPFKCLFCLAILPILPLLCLVNKSFPILSCIDWKSMILAICCCTVKKVLLLHNLLKNCFACVQRSYSKERILSPKQLMMAELKVLFWRQLTSLINLFHVSSTMESNTPIVASASCNKPCAWSWMWSWESCDPAFMPAALDSLYCPKFCQQNVHVPTTFHIWKVRLCL